MNFPTFASLLKQARKQGGLSQQALARKVGWTPAYICQLESGKRNPPCETAIRRLARVLKQDELEFLKAGFMGRAPAELRRRVDEADQRLRADRELLRVVLDDFLPVAVHQDRIPLAYLEAALRSLKLTARLRAAQRRTLERIRASTELGDLRKRLRTLVAKLSREEQAGLVFSLFDMLQLENAEPLLAARSPSLRRFVVEVTDDEMYPRLEQGDWLLVDPALEPATGDIVLVRVNRARKIRRFLQLADGFEISCPNPDIAPLRGKPDQLPPVVGVGVQVVRRLRREASPGGKV